MTQENAEIMRRAYATLEKQGVEEMLAFAHPDFEMTTLASLASEPDTYRGHDGVRRYFDSFGDAMEGVYLEGLEFIPAGDKVMAVASLRARGRSTGIEAEQRAFLVWTLRDGLVIGLEAFPERAEALEAARLEE